MDFKQNDLGKRDMIKNDIKLTKKGTNTLRSFTVTKYQKYPSTTIPKHPNVLAKVNKSP